MAPKTRPVSVSLPLTIKGDRARVSGGYNNNFILAEVRTRVVRKEKKTFLKVSNQESWLVAGVSGYRTARQIGALRRRTSLVAVLTGKCMSFPTDNGSGLERSNDGSCLEQRSLVR